MNDLTQTTLGMRRDDSGTFLPVYAELDIDPTNPFASIDQKGVGRLIEITCELGAAERAPTLSSVFAPNTGAIPKA